MIWIFLGIAVVHAAGALAAGTHQLLHYRNPAAAVAWLFALVFLPLLGPLAYLVLAYAKPRAMRRRTERAEALRRSRPETDREHVGDRRPRGGMHRLMHCVAAFPMTEGNALRIVDEGDDHGLGEQLDAIRAAEREVLVQTFVLNEGRVFEALFAALADRAAADVRVRLLIDPLGSQKLDGEALERLRRAGIECLEFEYPNPLQGRFQINFRNHRKILCIDGARVFTGGRNWADEYYPTPDDPRAFRDLTIEIRGPVVAAFHRVFREDWAIASRQDHCVADGDIETVVAGESPVRAVPFGRDEPERISIDVLGGAIRRARERIFAITPYFVPGEALAHDLRVAALCGVQIDLLLPVDSDSGAVDRAARTYFEPLLEAGARIYLLPGPLLHAKAMIVDGEWCLCGSANLDARSLFLNYELGIETTDREFCTALQEHFEPLLAKASQVDLEEFSRRGFRARLAEKAAALFEPLL